MSNAKHIPLRACLACREQKAKAELVRFVLIHGTVHVDANSNSPGRGAYTCAHENCLQTAIKRKVFHRAFRMNVLLDVDQLTEEFSECLKKK